MEVGLTAALACVLVQMAFRPVTQEMLYAPFRFFSVPTATASLRPAFSAVLVFTSADTFQMEPADDTVKARGGGAYTVAGDVAHISLRLTGLKPAATYAVECSGLPCSLKKPSVTADWKGRASFNIDRALLEGAAVIAVVLNGKGAGAEAQLSYSLPVTEP